MNKSEKTKNAIAAALVKMLDKQPLDLITIQALCRQAQVGRTAFYHNFHHKEDVLKYVYRKAHHETFQDRFRDLEYICSDAFTKDMIHFFNVNSELLLVLHKWHLIDIIAKYNTEMSLYYVRQYQDKIIQKNADYFVCYTGSLIFNICTLWIIQGKNISEEELFKTVKYFQILSATPKMSLD